MYCKVVKSFRTAKTNKIYLLATRGLHCNEWDDRDDLVKSTESTISKHSSEIAQVRS